MDRLIAWLVAPETRELCAEELMTKLAAALGDVGVDVDWLSLSVRTLHPEVFVRNVRWTPEAGAASRLQPSDLVGAAAYEGSPVAAIHRGVDEIRVRLDDEEATSRYGICRDLAAEGHTDYLILALPGAHELRSFVSCATRKPSGLSDRDVETLRGIVPALSLLVELASQRFATESLLRTYLGDNAARRVLAGAFQRGRGEQLDAVVWTCDLRGFSTMVDREPIDRVLDTLDRYFECVADPIGAEGGEVLKFIGDAVLAIFVREDGDTKAACEAALRASEGAFASLRRLNAERSAEGRSPLSFGAALHVGEVTYGNIGSSRRLDFTVIGRAVNEVTRVEGFCKTLDCPLLLTETFARLCGRDDLRSLGTHRLRGIENPFELFTLPTDG